MELIQQKDRLERDNPGLERSYRDFVKSYQEYQDTVKQLVGEAPERAAARTRHREK